MPSSGRRAVRPVPGCPFADLTRNTVSPGDRKRWSRRRRASGPAPRARRAALECPLLGRTRGLVVGPDAGLVEERHPRLNAAMLLCRFQQPLPGATSGRRSVPPSTTVPVPPGRAKQSLFPGAGRFRAVVVAPDNRLDRAPQVVMLGLVRRATCLDQRRKHLPLRVRENLHPDVRGGAITSHWSGGMVLLLAE